MTQGGGFGDFDDDRNIFNLFHQPEIDADDNQSDISIDSDTVESINNDNCNNKNSEVTRHFSISCFLSVLLFVINY